jgi:hypothetical protein
MLLYPAIYTVCTIPLAAGRIASMAGRKVPLEYFCIAGAMIACNGWLDVLLYSITRRSIVFSDSPPSDDAGLETFYGLGLKSGQRRLGNVTTIEAGGNFSDLNGAQKATHLRRGSKGRTSSSASTENLYGMAKTQSLGHGQGGFSGIKTETTVKVQREDVSEGYEMGVRVKGEVSQERLDKSWDDRSVRSFNN